MYTHSWTSLVAQMVNLPTIWETWVQSLGQEDLEAETAAHCSLLAWEIPWTTGYTAWGHKELDTT